MSSKKEEHIEKWKALWRRIDGDRSLGDGEYLEVLDEIQADAEMSATAKREELGLGKYDYP